VLKDFKYAAVIRSVKDNVFLRRTIDSLQEQTILPQEIIIVIPSDVEPWNTGELWKCVRFVQSERGMVSQRAAGIVAATAEFLLLLDDDIVLGQNAAEIMLQTMIDKHAACVVPCWVDGWPRKKIVKSFMAFWGLAIPQKTGGIRYTSGGGYFYPLNEPTDPWETEGGAGAVIMIDREFCVHHGCLGDMELQVVSVYALRDDGAFIFDISQKGGLCLMAGGIYFEHLGGTTRLDPKRLEMSYMAQVFNHYLFWHKYIYPQYSCRFFSKINSKISIVRYMIGIILLAGVASAHSMSFQPIIGICSGFKHLFKYRNSNI
jgi:glycosyltransferase involved in cell wall biosynthesis